MVWEKTFALEVEDLKPSQVWRAWEDVNSWHLWDTDIAYAQLEGPFEEGNSFELKPKSGPRVKIRLERVELNYGFTDVTVFPLAKMYGIHAMERLDGNKLRISHTVRINGPLSFLWKKIVAENVAAGIEEQSKKMVERARQVSE